MWQAWDFAVDISLSQLPNILEKNVQYNASSFFEEQLTAFEVWLKYGGEKRPPPEQVSYGSGLRNTLRSAPPLYIVRCIEFYTNFIINIYFTAPYCPASASKSSS